MNIESLLIAIHVIAAISIVGLVLIQRGKGADIGASFGSGASQTMFGTLGSGNLLTKGTTVMAIVFFATSLSLAVIASQRAESLAQGDSLLSEDVEQQQAPASSSRDAPDQAGQGSAETPAGGGDLPTVNEEDTGGGDLPTVDPQTEEQGGTQE